MKVGQKTVRINITVKMKDYELLRLLSTESIFFKVTSLATRYVIERVYVEAQKSKLCADYLKGGSQVDLFKDADKNRSKDSKKAI